MPHQKSEEGFLSVTEVLSLAINKPFLQYWFGKLGTERCEQIKRESQDIGIKVHSLIEWQFRNPDTRLNSESNENRMVNNFWNKFVIPYEVKPIAMEITLTDPKLRLQGTFDAHIDTNKGEFIADWKTSNSLDKVSVPLQLSAYAHLYNKGLNTGMAVRIDKETDKIEVKVYPDLDKHWIVFKAALKVAQYIKWGLK